MAEMGSGKLSPSPIRLKGANEAIRLAPVPHGTLTIKVSALYAAPYAISPGPIMPEGFITYTDFLPSDQH
jgi:hypothetical protein